MKGHKCTADRNFKRHGHVSLYAPRCARLKELAHQRQASFKETLNDVLRRGFSSPASRKSPGRFVVKPHAGGFRPGIDPDKLNQLLDELESEDFVTEASAPE